MEINEEYKGIKYTCTKEGNKFKGKVDLDRFSQEISRRNKYELIQSLKEIIEEFHNQHPNLSTSNKDTSSPIIYIVFAMLGIIWLAGLWFYFPESAASEVDDAAKTLAYDWLSEFGDFFNNLGAPVIALLSYFGLLYTLFQQNKAHLLSLDELELTRQELRNSSEAQRAQAEALDQQNNEIKSTAKREKFDSTFYSLLDKHNEILKSIEEDKLQFDSPNMRDIKEHYDEIHGSLNHCRYFRVLYQLLKFIAIEFSDEKKLSDKLFNSRVTEEEKSYASFVRSMISDHTLYLLAVNCYCPKGNKDPYFDYKRLITRYQFLEHLTFSGILDSSSYRHSEFNHCSVLAEYEREAFGQNVHLIEAEDEVARFTNSIQFKKYSDNPYANPIFKPTPEFNISEIDANKNSTNGFITSEKDLPQISELLLNRKNHFVSQWFKHISTEKNSTTKQLISTLVEDDIAKIIDGQQQRSL